MNNQKQTPKARPRTTEQVLGQQKQDADREYQKRQAPKQQELMPAPKPQLPAAPDSRTNLQRYLDDVAPASLVARMIKFGKEGHHQTHDDGEDVSEETIFIAQCDQTMCGYVKFNGEGEPPDRIMGLIYENFAMPPRETLGDLDESKWQTGLDGKPADPWQHTMYLVLENADTHEMFTFVTNSITGRRAVGNLLRHYERLQRAHSDAYPLVQLKAGGFNHRDPRVGWVAVPVFAVCGRIAKDRVTTPEPPPKDDLDDEVPFFG